MPDYGATTSSDMKRPKRSTSVTYCLHGKIAADCCDVESIDITIKNESHCHRVGSQRVEGIDKKARKKLIIASILCIFFMLVEIVGGILSNSLAIATDAAHLLADLASFMISLLALYIAQRKSTKRMSFGFHRAEVIGALISVLMIWVVTAILFYMAILRTIHLDFELNSGIMLISSGFGILVNIVMGCTLHDHHGHSHGNNHNHHSHHTKDEEEVGQRMQQNINIRAAFIHVVSDFVQSCGVFIASLIIFFKPELSIIDPICTFLFSALVLVTTLSIMKDALLVLMEGIPEFLDYSEIMKTFLNIDGVVRVHNLRIWALSVNKIALAAHLAVNEGTNTETVLREATRRIHAKYDFFETTLQIEVYEKEMESCKECTTNPE
ncbi:hypothetical protein PVAND_007338 [Polypedilum vanderplanki]|uniref:Uncharacterized protein n=1 Tax=Polypedilum vanderplanki TaxID=319348 RepID=A0A9J6C6N9_POLVA|nr:hypothetical protein PVAND_007338 [Polypedilum vanderplanki]